MKLVVLTFEGDLEEMQLENLTPSEVVRLQRIFFRFQQVDEVKKPDK